MQVTLPSTRFAPAWRTFLVGIFPFACLLSFAAAQVSADSAASTGDDSFVELSPFVVDSNRDVGYLAGNTLAGSRLNTSLKDTPAAISVLTSEFLSDIGAFDIKEALAYAVNVEFDLDDDRAAINGNSTIDQYQGYRVRGLPATVSRNYFKWTLPTESALVDRIEDSRGPNSVLFGIASPGGLINEMTKQARLGAAFVRGSLTWASYDSYRATLDVNQPLLKNKLGLRLNAVHNETNSFRRYQFQESDRVHLAGTYALSDRTRFRVEYERGEITSNEPRAANLNNSFLLWDASGRPTYSTQTANATVGVGRLANGAAVPRFTYIANDGVTISMRGTLMTTGDGPWGDGPITDTAIADPSINVGGPAQNRYSHFDGLSAYLEHRFGKDTHLELAYNHQAHKFDRYDPRNGPPQALTGDPNTLRRNGSANPYVGQLYLEGSWFLTFNDDNSDSTRMTLSHEWDLGRWGNYRIAGMGEYTDSLDYVTVNREMWFNAATRLPANNAVPDNANNIVWRRNYVTAGDWGSYYISGPGKRQGLLANVTEAESGRSLYSDWVPTNIRYVESTLKTAMVALQARYFDDKLILAAGFRRDDLDQHTLGRYRDPQTQFWRPATDAPATQDEQRVKAIGDTRSLGLVYHLTPRLSVFYNQSDNVSLPASFTRLPDSGEPGNPIPLEAPKGKGRDFGAALSLLDGRLYARATYFTTEAVDQSTTSPAPVRSANERIMAALLAQGLIDQAELEYRTNVGTQGVFDYAAKGVELQITANATQNWRFQVNYSYTDAVEDNLFNEWVRWHELNLAYLSRFDINTIVTESGRTIAQEISEYLTVENGLNHLTQNNGLNKLGNRPHKFNVFTRYDFKSGLFNRLYVGGGYRYQGKVFTGIISETDRTEVWGPAVGQLDLLAGYTLPKFTKARRLSLQLNLFNVLNETDPIVTRYNFDTGSARPIGYRPREGFTWRLTANFEF